MFESTRFVIEHATPGAAFTRAVEICEHKGIGHPDSLCDGVAEAVSRALCGAYLRSYGEVQHYNVDKALLVGGQSVPKFGGGRIVTPLRLIVCGRATALPDIDMDTLVCAAARDYLAMVLHCGVDIFQIESVVRSGSPNLQRVMGARARANDTSFGAGYAPFSTLEKTVLHIAEILRSDDFHRQFLAAGDDFKVMGMRDGEQLSMTVALAIIDHAVHSVDEYFDIKMKIGKYLRSVANYEGALAINALDDPQAKDEAGIYLTVSGLSAEHGDDGQVGRGNRVNGLITPCRTMSLEAAAGKNAVAHVGKLYNVLALEVARAIVRAAPAIVEASVQILSTIGRPVSEPTLIAIKLRVRDVGDSRSEQIVRDIVEVELGRIDQLSMRLIRGELAVF